MSGIDEFIVPIFATAIGVARAVQMFVYLVSGD